MKSDGIDFRTLKRSFIEQNDVLEFTVDDYSRSWLAYNPATALLDSGVSYRNIEFSVKDRSGIKHKFYCNAYLYADTKELNISSCESETTSLHDVNRLREFGYFSSVNLKTQPEASNSFEENQSQEKLKSKTAE